MENFTVADVEDKYTQLLLLTSSLSLFLYLKIVTSSMRASPIIVLIHSSFCHTCTKMACGPRSGSPRHHQPPSCPLTPSRFLSNGEWGGRCGGGGGGGYSSPARSNSHLEDDSDLSPGSELPGESARIDSESEASVSLDDYVYSSLADPHLDIRLVELLPGAFGEIIRVKIHHVPLVEPELKEDPRIPVTKLAETCPKPWSVCRNLEGRALFWRREDDGAITTSWRHPDPEFDSAQYELPPLENDNTHVSKFEALSYAWGLRKRCASIIVQGEFDTKLAVTRSLLKALQHLRDETQSRVMWIDAVCLNQEDRIEKGLQLPRMRDIYRLAYRVVVWLGSKSKRFELGSHWDRDKILVSVFKELEYIAAQVEVSEDGTSLWPAPDASEKDLYRRDSLRESASQDYQLTLDGLKQLLYSPWFRRLWVVQEIQLANKRPGPIMQCGSYTISISKFHRAIECLDLKTAKDNYSRRTARDTPLMLEWPVLNATRLLHPMSGVNHKIVLALNWNRKCQDDRDRIYGLLGLTSRQLSDQIQVRYDKPMADVYKDHFLRHLKLAGRLELLIDRQSIYQPYPTWVPDWSAKSNFMADMKIQFAAYNTRAHFKRNTNSSDILEVCGVRCSVVDHLREYLSVPRMGNTWEAVRQVRRWQPHCLDTAKYLPTGEPLRTAYLLTLLQGDTEDRWQSFGCVDLSMQKSSARMEPLQLRAAVNGPFSPEAWVHQDYNRPSLQKWVDQDYDHWLFERQSRRLLGGTGKEVPRTTPHPHIERALSGCYGRRFFQTQEGYMGLASKHTQEGDTIAILLGCLNPVILRPVRVGKGFEYIGECFVYGLQDSTWLLGPLPHPWKSCMVRCPGMRMCLGFKNTETGVETLEDPRLEAVDVWERFCPEEGKIPQHFPFEYCFFRNKETGEVVTYDPRLEPAELEAKGIDLTWFSLI